MLESRHHGLTPDAYRAVLALRRAGHRVTCARRDEDGRETHHNLDGTIVPTSWLFDLSSQQRAARPREAQHE